MKSITLVIKYALAGLISAVSFSSYAESVGADVKIKLDARIKTVSEWASDAVIKTAVKACNANESKEDKEMTQDKWKTLTILDPIIKGFTKNKVADFIKSKKDEAFSEAFVSCADGRKLAFLSKTSSWSHKGKPKHDVPMTGKTWIGDVETDESTGKKQVQIAVPIFDDKTPIGSLVIGYKINSL